MFSRNTIALFVDFLLVVGVYCGNAAKREPRFIRGTYTETKIENRLITSLVPSSCVYVDATLPPCRNVRYLHFPAFYSKDLPEPEDKIVRTIAETSTDATPLGWGEYLGLYAPTVTVTQTKLQTTYMQDHRIVITFAVRGCKPLRIPNDLDRCPQEPTFTLPILPTSTIAISQMSTKASTKSFSTNTADNVADAVIDTINKIKEIEKNSQANIESSRSDEDNYESSKPTKPL